jgi:hypothetical protein
MKFAIPTLLAITFGAFVAGCSGSEEPTPGPNNDPVEVRPDTNATQTEACGYDCIYDHGYRYCRRMIMGTDGSCH